MSVILPSITSLLSFPPLFNSHSLCVFTFLLMVHDYFFFIVCVTVLWGVFGEMQIVATLSHRAFKQYRKEILKHIT